MATVVVYVHGLWLGGGESFLLRRRLARALGAQTRVFAYSSADADAARNAAALGAYLQAIRADTVHVVGHSMGGVLILETFERGYAAKGAFAGSPGVPPGRIVLTGAPVCGSRSARRFARLPFGRALLGRTARDVLLAQRSPRWTGERELGVIAGDLAAGLGRLLGRMESANDGTVLVEETDLPGATAQLRRPVSHTGLVFSADIARQIAEFLGHGRFAP